MKIRMEVFIFVLLFAPLLYGAEGIKSDKSGHGLGKVTGTPAQTILDINNMTTWVRDDGFFDWVVEGSWNGTFPKGTIGDIFSQGMVWGGFVNDGKSPALRVGGSTYSTGMQAGSILTDATGKVTGAEDPTSSSVRIFRVRPDYKTADLTDDAANLLSKRIADVTSDDQANLRAQYQTDWNDWPAAKGAPFDDRDSNGVYDPNVDIPGIPGADQTVFFISNDLGGNAGVYGSPSIGLEMQMTLWGYSSELFANLQFKRVRLIYKGTPSTPKGSNITDMFITQWSDPDDGNSGDDFAGCDTALSLGYVYNGNAQDAFYQDRFGLPPPAVGFKFLQGVRIKGTASDTAIFDFKKLPGYKNLPMTTFSYFAAGSSRSDPDLGTYAGTLQWYNLMRGGEPRPEYPSFVPFRDNNGNITRFELAGDPAAGTGDLDGRKLPPGDRRILLATGTFTMNLGDTQEVVIAQVNGLGGDNVSSVSILKNNSRFAQDAYNALFKSLPGAPPPPVVSVAPLNNKIVLNWGSDQASVQNIEAVNRQGWQFEGYNVYQLHGPSITPNFPNDEIRLATYDLTSDEDNAKFGQDVKTIVNRSFDPTAKIFVLKPRQIGTDNGIQRFITITNDAIRSRPLVNGQTYYFAVTAYSFNPDSAVDFHALESVVQILAVVPQSTAPGQRYTSAQGESVASEHITGTSDGSVAPVVIDPSKTTGHRYHVTFQTDTLGSTTWSLIDSTLHDSVRLKGQVNQADNNDYPVVDGMLIRVLGPQPGMKGWAVPSGARHFSPTGGFAGLGLEGFSSVSDTFAYDQAAGTMGMGGHLAFGAITTTLTNAQYHTVLLKFAAVDPAALWDPKATPTDTNFSRGYRWLRRAVDPPRDPSFAPWIIHTTGTYVYQDYNYSVPFSAWDMETSPPTRLSVGMFENNVVGGLVDGRYWPPVAGEGDNSVAREFFFIFSTPYSTTPDPTFENDLNTTPLPIMWVSTANRRNDNPWVSGDEFEILANHVNAPGDIFAFTAPGPATSNNATAQADVTQINVFPNPYYGFNTSETDRLQKYVTFNHLPARATLRIFNLGGVLVRTLNKDDPGQFTRWDLRNENNLPVASGIYIVYIEMPGVGTTKTVKLALVQEEQILRTY